MLSDRLASASPVDYWNKQYIIKHTVNWALASYHFDRINLHIFPFIKYLVSHLTKNLYLILSD